MVASPQAREAEGGHPPPVVTALASGDLLRIATAYDALGVSTFPTKLGGSKEPLFAGWREFAERRPTPQELARWYGGRARCGIGVTGGTASGNLAVLDFETRAAFDAWCALLTGKDRVPLARCPVIWTPGRGAHVWVRLPEPARGQKLAKEADGKTLVEVRGCQHYVMAPGSPPSAHATGRPYRLAKPGWLDGRGHDPMPLGAYHGLTVHAAELNRYRRPAAREVIGDRPTDAPGDRPGDHFNRRVAWGDVLGPCGWRVFHTTPTAMYWCRPGKTPAGVSASTGFCKGPSGNDLLYVWSTSAAPFEAETSYSKFAAYGLLYHHGDFRAATRALGAAGYGRREVRK